MALPHATEMKRGGVRVDLLPDPAAGTFETLSAAQPAVVAVLREASVLAEGLRGFTLAERALLWPVPEWHMRKKKT